MPEFILNEKIKNKYLRTIVAVLFWAIIVVGISHIFKYFLNQILPLVFGFILAAVARPLSKFLSRDYYQIKKKDGTLVKKKKIKVPEKLAAIISVVVLLLIIGGIASFFIAKIVNIIVDYARLLPTYFTEVLQPGFANLYEKLELWFKDMDPEIENFLQTGYNGLVSNLGQTVSEFSAKVLQKTVDIPSLLLSSIITVIATVFFAIDFGSMKTFLKRLVSPKTWDMGSRIKASFLDMIWQFLRSYALIFVITVAEITVGMMICGYKNAFLIGLLIGIFDAFPIVGSGMILLPWSIIALLTGPLWKGLGVLILWAVVVIVRQFIEPKIVGTRVGLRPLVTLVCMYVGNKLLGVWGLFGFPITAAIISDLEQNGYIHLFWDERNGEKADARPEESITEKKDAESCSAESANS